MSNQTLPLDDALYDYLLSVSLRESPVLAALREETAHMEMANMQIAPEQGQFMAFLLKAIGAKRYLEVGTFTGYSALVCALALPGDGEVYALDVSEEWTAVARRYWEEAGVAGRIHLELGDAAATLARLEASDAGTFDFVFIDADKTGYAGYIESALTLLRTGGLIAIDNVLRDGNVIDPDVSDDDTCAIREVNEALLSDDRVDLSMVPIGDGLTLARKRSMARDLQPA
ncbi:MAG: SAM-dependent methyltransferase [Chromatiales bacterium]|jgi:predicted O-methyltransferase YrrM|nr:SAM-dependent methyltransferase [Chromatiales bacterium]MDP7271821.1 class I SAM-dependent methyltransferase [Gammaproteobacteria bacterium]HJP04672.1 class I SAM-dependent methyltransferase [Gammaproteobacteria bacterium]